MKLLKNCKTIKGLKFEYGGEFNFVYNSSTTNHSAYRPEFNCETEHKNKRHVIYAHCVDDKIVYIGETSNTFYKRMYYYCNHKGPTNVRVRDYFEKQYIEGKEIETYLYKPENVLIEGLMINPYIGIEQKLINELNPILNHKDVF